MPKVRVTNAFRRSLLRHLRAGPRCFALVTAHLNKLTAEISPIKGAQGVKGYPF